MTIDELIARSLEQPSSAVLGGTERRDVVTAQSRRVVRAKLGTVVETTFRLNGDRISQRAADLLLRAFPLAEA